MDNTQPAFTHVTAPSVAGDLMTTLHYWPARWGRPAIAAAIALSLDREATPQEWCDILDQLEAAVEPIERESACFRKAMPVT
jgi:hypothetical protein